MTSRLTFPIPCFWKKDAFVSLFHLKLNIICVDTSTDTFLLYA